MRTPTSVFQLKDLSASSSAPSLGGLRLWTLSMDLPGEKVNKLSRAVIDEVQALLPELQTLGREKKIDALVLISSKPKNFIAGADIEMIQAVRTAQEAEELSRTGQELLNQWEDLPFPTIAGIDGAALGGGCEFALACSGIVMSNDSNSKIGLPEVNLGIIPGMGGCVRLPRKVGLASALDLILSGRTLSGEKAYKLGLVEACLPKENFHESLLRWVQMNFDGLRSGKRLAKIPKLGGMGGPVGSVLEKSPLKSVILKKARDTVLEKTRGKYPAPLKAIEVLQESHATYGEKLRGEERRNALALEARGFGELAVTNVSKNLIRLFFLTEQVKKSKGLAQSKSSQPEAVTPKSVTWAAVLGAGVMGGGIARLLAEKDLQVRMKDLNSAALTLGMQSAIQIFQKQVQKRKINARQMVQKLNHIAPVTDYTGFNRAELVIEAIVENIEIKKTVFKELETKVRPDCVIASNTSSLSITAMSQALQRPERFVGMHFFNPVHRMPLIEVIRGEKTSDSAVATIFQLSKTLGKTPIVVKDSPGFLVNRLLATYLNEAVHLLAAGVPIDELDRVLLEFGMPMGPMELLDEVGIDVADKVAHILQNAFGERMKAPDLNRKILDSKRLGKKTGQGLYRYEGPKKKKDLDPEVYSLLKITPRPSSVPETEIVERCIFPMINEAARCLEEQVVTSSADVDLGMIMGTGFPPFRGGLLRYADSVGVGNILERLSVYQKVLGSRFEPSGALRSRAGNGQSFYA